MCLCFGIMFGFRHFELPKPFYFSANYPFFPNKPYFVKTFPGPIPKKLFKYISGHG